MTRTAEPLDPGADVRGRTVVWSAGSATLGPRRRPHPVVRSLGLVTLAAIAVFALTYAVHTFVVMSPPPSGPAAPLWLPDQLPAGDGSTDTADDVRPSAVPTTARTSEPAAKVKPVTSPGRSRAAAHGTDAKKTTHRPSSHPRPSTPARTSGQRSSGSGSGSGSGSDHDGGSTRTRWGRGGGSDDSGSSRGSGSHGSGSSGSGSHGSHGSSSGHGSGHGGDDDAHSSGGSKGGDDS